MAAPFKPRVDDAANDAALVTAFTAFAYQLGTPPTEPTEHYRRAEPDVPQRVTDARDDALVAAYHTIERIAVRTV